MAEMILKVHKHFTVGIKKKNIVILAICAVFISFIFIFFYFKIFCFFVVVFFFQKNANNSIHSKKCKNSLVIFD